jgi:thioredoxin-dependent peroxiredoxin
MKLTIKMSATLALLGLAHTASLAALQTGDAAPAFEARAALDGRAFAYSLKDALRQGPVVVYFYPAAFTGGCSLQAKAFAQRHEQFRAAGATVIGVSLDPIERLQAFSADPDTCAGQVAVASDAEGRIARAFEVAVGQPEAGRKNRRGEDILNGRAERTTFVVTPDGRIAAAVDGVAPLAHVEQALAVVQGLAAKPRP